MGDNSQLLYNHTTIYGAAGDIDKFVGLMERANFKRLSRKEAAHQHPGIERSEVLSNFVQRSIS